MTTLEKYRDEVKKQVNNGTDFEKNVFAVSLSTCSELAKVAAKYGYRRPRSSYFGTGKAFYLCLQRVYNQMKQRGEL